MYDYDEFEWLKMRVAELEEKSIWWDAAAWMVGGLAVFGIISLIWSWLTG